MWKCASTTRRVDADGLRECSSRTPCCSGWSAQPPSRYRPMPIVQRGVGQGGNVSAARFCRPALGQMIALLARRWPRLRREGERGVRLNAEPPREVAGWRRCRRPALSVKRQIRRRATAGIVADIDGALEVASLRLPILTRPLKVTAAYPAQVIDGKLPSAPVAARVRPSPATPQTTAMESPIMGI